MHCRVFFFQAEDGIRDLVRSRGLGDVYKRQVQFVEHLLGNCFRQNLATGVLRLGHDEAAITCASVSYTHLTLPTSDLV